MCHPVILAIFLTGITLFLAEEPWLKSILITVRADKAEEMPVN